MTMTDQELARLWHLGFRSANRVLHNVHVAEEVAQEAVFAVWEAYQHGHGEDRVADWSSWVWSTARYLALKVERRDKRLVCCALDNLLIGTDAETAYSMSDLLLSVPTSEWPLFNLRYIRGLTVRDISRTLELPIGTVKWRLHRIRQYLRKTLDIQPRVDSKAAY